MTPTIPQDLLEKALALTGGSYSHVCERQDYNQDEYFSIEKFCYYLLSPEFIQKLHQSMYIEEDDRDEGETVYDVGEAIYEYQLGNPEPITTLLSNI